MNDQRRNNDDDHPEPLAIESLDDYVRRYGLPSANGEGQNGGEFNGLNRIEAMERVRAEERYRDRIIEEHQATTSEEKQQQHENENDGLDSEGAVVSVLLADNMSKNRYSMPVKPLIAFCDTARRMVTSRWRHGVQLQRDDDDGAVVNDSVVDGSNADDGETKQSEEAGKNSIEESTSTSASPILTELSLVEFDSDAVVQFMEVLISLHDHHQEQQQMVVSSLEEVSRHNLTSPSRKRRMNMKDNATTTSDDDAITNEHLTSLLNEGKISEQHIVEHLKLAHFLQCRSILDTLIPIVQLSIDSDNCMAICSLADVLNLKSLFEASVNYVIERLDAFQGTTTSGGGAASLGDNSEGRASSSSSSSSGRVQQQQRRSSSSTISSSITSNNNNNDNGEGETAEEIWASLPHELRSRVLTMRNVMRSSVIGRGSKVSGLFFSSGSEFLAIFYETIRDQRERLAEAKERGDEVVRERKAEWVVRCERRRGRWFDASSEAREKFVYGPDVVYAMGKVEKQVRRLETLESFYDEQKAIFKGGGFGSEIRL